MSSCISFANLLFTVSSIMTLDQLFVLSFSAITTRLLISFLKLLYLSPFLFRAISAPFLYSLLATSKASAHKFLAFSYLSLLSLSSLLALLFFTSVISISRASIISWKKSITFCVMLLSDFAILSINFLII